MATSLKKFELHSHMALLGHVTVGIGSWKFFHGIQRYVGFCVTNFLNCSVTGLTRMTSAEFLRSSCAVCAQELRRNLAMVILERPVIEKFVTHKNFLRPMKSDPISSLMCCWSSLLNVKHLNSCPNTPMWQHEGKKDWKVDFLIRVKKIFPKKQQNGAR